MSDAFTFALARRARGACSSSTTIRCTPTASSTELHATARRRWSELGGDPALVEMGMEGGELEIGATAAPAGFATTA